MESEIGVEDKISEDYGRVGKTCGHGESYTD
jgi:hypothetical protein